MEEEEAAAEHDEGDGAKGDVQISPALVFVSCAAWRLADVAGFKPGLAGVIGYEAPSNLRRVSMRCRKTIMTYLMTISTAPRATRQTIKSAAH